MQLIQYFIYKFQNLNNILESRQNKNPSMKKQEANRIQCLNGPPVDYSFKSIRSLNELLLQKRKHDSIQNLPQQQTNQQTQKKTSPQQNLGQENNAQQYNAQNPYQTKLQIVRTIQISQTKILDMNKNASKKKQKNQKKLTKQIDSKSSALFLRYNKITSIQGIYSIVQKIFPDIKNLIWIDLSFNRLVQLVDELAQFPNLKNIYLHCNFIYDFKQIQKLAKIKQLRSLTIHANPLQKYQEFRVLIANIVPQLQKIDSTLLTNRQKSRGEVIKKQMKKYPIIKNPEPRPQQLNLSLQKGIQSI